jgi:hypothetical protein
MGYILAIFFSLTHVVTVILSPFSLHCYLGVDQGDDMSFWKITKNVSPLDFQNQHINFNMQIFGLLLKIFKKRPYLSNQLQIGRKNRPIWSPWILAVVFTSLKFGCRHRIKLPPFLSWRKDSFVLTTIHSICEPADFGAGLPDFSWYMIPKLENVPN